MERSIFNTPWEALTEYQRLWCAHFTATVRDINGKIIRTASPKELDNYIEQMRGLTQQANQGNTGSEQEE